MKPVAESLSTVLESNLTRLRAKFSRRFQQSVLEHDYDMNYEQSFIENERKYLLRNESTFVIVFLPLFILPFVAP